MLTASLSPASMICCALSWLWDLAQADGVFDQRCVLGDLGCLQHQGGVGGGIDGLVALDGFDVAGIGNHCGQGFQLG
jgi:hypothetical protein